MIGGNGHPRHDYCQLPFFSNLKRFARSAECEELRLKNAFYDYSTRCWSTSAATPCVCLRPSREEEMLNVGGS